jgi:hypothetical protein
MTQWNIYRLERTGSRLVAKHLMQVKAKNHSHAIHVAMTELQVTDPVELLGLSARDAKFDDWHKPKSSNHLFL